MSVIVEKDISKETLDCLHNLVAAVILLERQQDEEGLARAILQVMDFIKGENITTIRDLMDWIGKLFTGGPEPVAVHKLRNLGGAQTMPAAVHKLRNVGEAQTMLRTLAKKIQKNAENAHLEGVLEGELKGELKGKLETAKAMLRDRLPLETVIRYTGLTDDQLAWEMQKDSGV